MARWQSAGPAHLRHGGMEVPSAVGLYLRKHLPKSNLVELAGVDHFCFASRPTIINALIDDFIHAKS